MLFPTLHQLQIFVTVARRQSFARAAEELFLSAPSVSLQVQRLEQHYGTRLFERTSRGPVLTEAGAILREAAEAIFARLREAAGAIEQTRASAHQRLGVGATISLGIYRLPAAVAAFRRRLPQVEVNLLLTTREQVEEALLRGTIDVAVLSRDVLSPHLHMEPFTLEPLELLVHPGNPLAALDPVPRAALAGQTLLLREPGSRTREALERAMERHGLRFREVVEVQGMDGLVRAVVEDRGIGFGPATFCEPERRLGQLVVTSIADVTIEIPFYLAYRANQPLGEPARAFLQCCKDVLA